MERPISRFIAAVENLDCIEVSNLLNHNKLYCGVTKETFIHVLSDVFIEINADASIQKYLTAYPAQCTENIKHENSFIFVDSMGFSKLTIALQYNDIEIISIEICNSPKCKEHNFYIFNSLRFYPDDKPGFVFTKEHLERKAKIESAVHEFENEYKMEGILYPEFIVKWWIANVNLKNYRENNFLSFRYQIPIRELFYMIHPYFQLAIWTPSAKKMIEDFFSISIVDTGSVLRFLKKDENNIPHISHEALEDWNFAKGFTIFQGFRIFIPPLFFSHNAYLLASWYESDFFDEGLITESIHKHRLILQY